MYPELVYTKSFKLKGNSFCSLGVNNIELSEDSIRMTCSVWCLGNNVDVSSKQRSAPDRHTCRIRYVPTVAIAHPSRSSSRPRVKALQAFQRQRVVTLPRTTCTFHCDPWG